MSPRTTRRWRGPLLTGLVLAVVVAAVGAARERAFARSEAEFRRTYGG